MEFPAPYQPMSRMAALARDGSGVWAMLGVLIGFEIVFYLSPSIAMAIFPGTPFWVDWGRPEPAATTLLQLASFVIAAFALAMLVKGVHRRNPATLLGVPDGFRTILIRVTLFCVAARLVIDLFTIVGPLSETVLAYSVPAWVLLMIPGLAAVFIQVTTEELLYRGYLQQQLAARFRSPLVWMVLPSVYFGVAHYYNGFGPADGTTYAIWATALGLACADLTARTGNIAAAVGLHLANNIFPQLIYAVEGYPGSGLALFLWEYDDPFAYDWGWSYLWTFDSLFGLVFSLMMLLILWLAARLAIRR